MNRSVCGVSNVAEASAVRVAASRAQRSGHLQGILQTQFLPPPAGSGGQVGAPPGHPWDRSRRKFEASSTSGASIVLLA